MNLVSHGIDYAGYFTNTIIAAVPNGNPPIAPVVNLAVPIYESDGTTVATIYTDQTRSSTAPNPTTTDNWGHLSFFADPGIYTLSFDLGGVVTVHRVQVLPWPSGGIVSVG